LAYSSLMRAFILVLAVAGCGTEDRQGLRDMSGGGGLPDSHISTEDGGTTKPMDFAGLDLLGVDFTVLDFAGTNADLTVPAPLDPNLSLPNPSGQTCTSPGSFSGCPSVSVCRFYTPTEGRCESCTQCGNLNAVCSASNQCDILFMCYKGRCTNFCTLGTSECGPPQDCINIGHPTRGVCKV
jgi:hypothetical protein